ncbi:MAG: polysaccharide deacetylase family protein [Gammaproteobacteria bacterium]|nr:polysaccharide deacetylase family protein [Gammaproteobacteria bacterium]
MRLLCLVVLFLAAPAQAGVVFMYHRFGESEYPSTNIRMEQFERQLEYLAENGYEVWPLPRLAAALEAGENIPDRVVALTIDDAYASVHGKAWPLLRRYDFPFTVFVSTDMVDSGASDYMSWQQLRELHAAGVTLANHTATHDYLVRRKDAESETAWLRRVSSDIGKAQRRLQEELGKEANESPRLFAWPYGEYSLALKDRVEKMGYLAFGQHSGAVYPGADLQALPRFPVNERYGELDDFSLKAGTRGFPVQTVSPVDPVRNDAVAPELRIRFGNSDARLGEMVCYFGSERIEPEQVSPGEFVVQAGGDLPMGRSRYNCTAPGPDGRYYWYSHLWIRTR